MSGSMQALTAFELEAVRRQEVLLADARDGRRNAETNTGVVEAGRRITRRLGTVAGGVVALAARGGTPMTGSPRS